MRHHAASDWAKPRAPIAQVLNDTASIQYASEPLSTQLPLAAPFSGKLADLLLDTPEQQLLNVRKRADYQLEESSRIVCDNSSVITLPQPPKLPTKSTKRARIPPLLQGLHQPPPLPPAERLFPPITHGASGFEQDICGRVQSGNSSEETRSKTNRDTALPQFAEPNDRDEAQAEDPEVDREGIPSSTLFSQRPENEISAQVASDNVADQEAPQNLRSRKRKKWSDEETRDLLLGVSRFGIGKWKRILQCHEFKFNERTAVDLKDRFRVCYPSEGQKPKRTKRKGKAHEQAVDSENATIPSKTGEDALTAGDTGKDLAESGEVFTKGVGNVHRMSHPELAKLGIQTPFAQSTRRPRHVFSAQDDENLLRGFEMHGAGWHLMRDNENLGFGARHPTDLRDRFRIRYPEAYARAGYKIKTKTKSSVRVERDRNPKRNTPASRPPKPSKTTQTPSKPHPQESPPTNDPSPRYTLNPPPPTVRSSPYQPLIPSSAPFFLSDHTLLSPSDHDATNTTASLSPIILNRDILTWADAQPSSSTQSSQPLFQYPLNPDISHDGIHINPLVTLKLPMMGHASFTHGGSGGGRTSYAEWPMMGSKELLRTPNLPTIVYPHVPASSARGMLHNLPTVGDLLEGVGEGMGMGGEHGGEM